MNCVLNDEANRIDVREECFVCFLSECFRIDNSEEVGGARERSYEDREEKHDLILGYRHTPNREQEVEDETVRGKYWRGVQLVEIGTDSDNFPGFQAGVVLAHEVGHAFYEAWSPESGIEE